MTARWLACAMLVAGCATPRALAPVASDEPVERVAAAPVRAEAWPVFDWRFVREPGLRRAEALAARAGDAYAQARDALGPRHGTALHYARALDALPALERARDDFERALALAPHLAAARIELADVLDQMGTIVRDNGEPTAARALVDQALAHLERVRPLVRDDARLRAVTLLQLGIERTRAERLPDARDAYTELLAEPLPDDARAGALCNLAEIQGDLGDLARAVATFEQCLAVRSDASALWGLAVVHDRAGSPAWAAQLATRALAEDPTLERLRGPGVFFVPASEVHYYLALAHEAEGRFGDARDAWQAFLDLGGDAGPWAARARDHLARATERAARDTDALLSDRSPRRRSSPRRQGARPAPATTSRGAPPR